MSGFASGCSPRGSASLFAGFASGYSCRGDVCLPAGFASGYGRRGIVYLLEPVLVAIVVVLMLALFLPQQHPEPDKRLMYLHAQDVLALIQKDGSLGQLAAGNNATIQKNLELLRELNPAYGYRIKVVGIGNGTVIAEKERGNAVKARRTFVKGGTHAEIELTIYI